jgi:glutaminase
MSSPAASPIQTYLERLHARLAEIDGGRVATYIPELAKADPAHLAIVIATVDGQVYEAGDARAPFTIQSISKPLVYGIALEDRGEEGVRRAIGVEPSGEAFNSISLEPGSGRPLNPMINAGAIAAASLVAGRNAEERLARMLGALSAYAGRELDIDEAVFASERDTGHRNRAIGHLLRNYDILTSDPEPALELYFRQCSVRVCCRDLAVIAATLANGGINPLTHKRAVQAEYVGPILSVMTTSGVYDFTGEWVYRVGLPAKSGVGGGIIAVLPGQLGIGVFSPPLDERGNSVRGVKACEAISRDLGLHFLQPPRASASTVRASYTLANVRSKRRRTPPQARVLEAQGQRAVVFELQGDLRFATLEPVLRRIVDAGEELLLAVLDFKRVSRADPAAVRLLASLVDGCADRGQQVVLTRVRRGDLLAGLGDAVHPRNLRAMNFQPQLDLGLEWCERVLLERFGAPRTPSSIASLAEHRLCEGISAADLALLESASERRTYEPGAVIVRRGEPADAIYFLLAGEVSVVFELAPGGEGKRLSTLSAGMGFGEAAVFTGGLRTADVRADTAVVCRVLAAETFRSFEAERPSLTIRLLQNLLQAASRTTLRLTREVAALEG